MKGGNGMSVTDMDKVDIMGLAEEGKCLQMVISDHLDWEDEETHLLILQDKINAYLAMIQNKAWMKENAQGAQYVKIVVFFLEDITENCQKFLQVVQDQVGQYGVRISAMIADDTFRRRVDEADKEEAPPKKSGFRFPFFKKRDK